jgi:hypothetical protein
MKQPMNNVLTTSKTATNTTQNCNENHAMEDIMTITITGTDHHDDVSHVTPMAADEILPNDEPTTTTDIQRPADVQLAQSSNDCEVTGQPPAACQTNNNNPTTVFMSDSQPFHGHI